MMFRILFAVSLLASTGASAEVWKRFRCEAKGPGIASGASGPNASHQAAEDLACGPCVAQSPTKDCRLSCEQISSGQWRPILGNRPNCR